MITSNSKLINLLTTPSVAKTTVPGTIIISLSLKPIILIINHILAKGLGLRFKSKTNSTTTIPVGFFHKQSAVTLQVLFLDKVRVGREVK